MKLIADPTGRFAKRPFYEPAELDSECELLMGNFLRKQRGKVSYPVSTEDLTVLIEQHVNDFDSYADLGSRYGDGVEGVTEFRPGQKPNVRIDRSLMGDSSRENRLRTTLTHEFGHARFHAWLFDERAGPSLFPKPPSQDDVQVCKRETMLDASQSNWMEWQAGHVCGAILMPASRVRRLAKGVAERVPPPALEPITAEGAFGSALIGEVVTAFQVSREAAQVRLHRLQLLSSLDLRRSR